MSNVESIGERLYRRVITPVWSEDRRQYSCGCIVRGNGDAVKVMFLRYELGKGIVGRCKPSGQMAEWLKCYGRELKAYVLREDERERDRLRRWNVSVGRPRGRF